MSDIYQFTIDTAAGQPQPLEAYRGRVLLIVNTASKCGFTPQYAGLQELHDQYHQRGLTILALPCNQFGGQEPGSNEEIQNFCQVNYGLSFPVMGKLAVNGDAAHPLYQWLKSERGGLLGSNIKWNFTKFLIGRDGQVLERFAPLTKPAKLSAAIEQALDG
ncbi:glutathione peroxidase [Gammaproteobacteria bacterium LSUCC0057]|uniref:Glutathione peroxidase n=1 Tax=Gammaproteobacteria bacterium LSUCC0057 TaxID=2559237 RepID=A0A4Y8UFV5_9GAMM|nr:glutathione peroxidase [Gammaproteobacteria bacterium LSUCC0057]